MWYPACLLSWMHLGSVDQLRHPWRLNAWGAELLLQALVIFERTVEVNEEFQLLSMRFLYRFLRSLNWITRCYLKSPISNLQPTGFKRICTKHPSSRFHMTPQEVLCLCLTGSVLMALCGTLPCSIQFLIQVLYLIIKLDISFALPFQFQWISNGPFTFLTEYLCDINLAFIF